MKKKTQIDYSKLDGYFDDVNKIAKRIFKLHPILQKNIKRFPV